MSNDATKEEAEESRLESLEELKESWETDEEGLIERFGPGTFGRHEVTDRAAIFVDNIAAYILGSGPCALDSDLNYAAQQAFDAMYDFYQKCACEDIEADDDARLLTRRERKELRRLRQENDDLKDALSDAKSK